MGEILSKLGDQSYLPISAAERKMILDHCALIREDSPPLAEPLLTLRWETSVLVLESTDRQEILLRRFAEETPAREFVRRRMDTYDRMWDGCGCKVDYYE